MPENRVAVIGIMVEDRSAAAQINSLLSEYGDYIIGRMGVPYKQKHISVVCVIADAPADVLNSLTPREAKVLRLRYGLDDGKARTLEEVGKEFNVTRERIRQIEAKALRKLRHPSRSKKLKDFLD